MTDPTFQAPPAPEGGEEPLSELLPNIHGYLRQTSYNVGTAMTELAELARESAEDASDLDSARRHLSIAVHLLLDELRLLGPRET